MERPSSAPQTAPPVLALERVDVPSPADARVVAIRDVHWQVQAGECWLVAGQTGAGKTSLLQVSAGLVRPLRGVQRLFGADLALVSEHEQLAVRRRIGVVFGEGGRLFANLTVAGNLALPLLYHDRERRKDWESHVERVLGELELGEFAGRTPRQLPRRISQRVALARALMLEPEVLLLDDPGTGQSPEEMEWWLEFVDGCARGRSRVTRAPRTLVVATLDPRRWGGVASKLGRVADGRWTEVGTESAIAAGPGLRPDTGG